MLTQEPGSEMLLISACGRGLLLFVMEHWRHKSKSRNADYILIAEGDTFPSEPSEPFEPSESCRAKGADPRPYFKKARNAI
jgi:hypothetical protein